MSSDAERSWPVVLFDLDGVLVDSRRPITEALAAALHDMGAPARPAAELQAFIGPPLHAAMATLLDLAPDTERVDQAVARYRHHYLPLARIHTRPVEGMAELMAALRREGRRLGIVTSKARQVTEALLSSLPFEGLFDVIDGPDLTAVDEPKAAGLRRVLVRLDVDPAHAVLVGDRYHDVDAAKVCGVTSIGVTWGIGTEAELSVAGVDHLVGSVAELAPLLRHPGADPG